ncbi:MAG: hypothetical protein KatS3mg011_1833 [Acidimicrobiia bacterium]|nr:MAG: hypothetical protein KatS3mg011_1833 [Acidimicrobiia bacterium]
MSFSPRRTGSCWISGPSRPDGRSSPFPHLTRASVERDETVRAALEFAGELDGRLPDIEVWELDDELYAEVEGLRVRLGGPTEMAAKARVLVELVGRDLPPGSEVVLVAPSRPAVRPPTQEPPEESTSS